VENLERYRSRGRYTAARRIPENKYNKGSDGANDAEWTKSGVNVEREGKMKTTEIKENEDFAARDWDGKKRRSHQARCTRAKVTSTRMKKRKRKTLKNG